MATLSAFALTSLGRIRDVLPELQVSSKDEGQLIQLVNDVTSLLEVESRRRLKARTFRPSGAGAGEENLLLSGNRRISEQVFHLPEWPVNSITSIVIKPSNLDPAGAVTLTAGEDWTLEEATGRVILIDGDTWTLGENNIEMVWNAGYVTTHKEWPILEKACLDQVRYEWFRLKNPQDLVTSISDAGGSVSYFQGPLLPQVRMVLENTFRRRDLL